MPPYNIYLYYNYKKKMPGRYIQWNNERLEYFMPVQKSPIALNGTRLLI